MYLGQRCNYKERERKHVRRGPVLTFREALKLYVMGRTDGIPNYGRIFQLGPDWCKLQQI
jgi:hypothetical protein